MGCLKNKFLKYGSRYKNHHKLVVYRHYAVYFINDTKHIEDISPDVRKSMVVSSFEPDVNFLLDGVKFPAHKRVLKISNEQFYVQHIEQFQDTSEIVIAGVDPRGFQQFLRFCHFGDLNLNPLNMMQAYDVAHTYHHSRLLSMCCSFICEAVETSNVLEILDWNLNHQNYQIMRVCRGFFIEHAMTILRASDQFHKISKNLLKIILGWDVLNCSEKLLFNATVKWAEVECEASGIEATAENKKKTLEDILYLIRLDISNDLEVVNDFPINPRANRFSKRRFDNLFIQRQIEQTWEEIPASSCDVACNGFSLIFSNPESIAENCEHFLMTLESSDDLVYQKKFNIKSSEYLSIKDFVFEEPIIMRSHKRHFLKVKFVDSHRLRYMERDESTNETCARILRLYD